MFTVETRNMAGEIVDTRRVESLDEPNPFNCEHLFDLASEDRTEHLDFRAGVRLRCEKCGLEGLGSLKGIGFVIDPISRCLPAASRS